MILTGESETLEFKEKLDKGKPERLAKTAVAFANTKGGTIVFGIDDDHHVSGTSFIFVAGIPRRRANLHPSCQG